MFETSWDFANYDVLRHAYIHLTRQLNQIIPNTFLEDTFLQIFHKLFNSRNYWSSRVLFMLVVEYAKVAKGGVVVYSSSTCLR